MTAVVSKFTKVVIIPKGMFEVHFPDCVDDAVWKWTADPTELPDEMAFRTVVSHYIPGEGFETVQLSNGLVIQPIYEDE